VSRWPRWSRRADKPTRATSTERNRPSEPEVERTALRDFKVAAPDSVEELVPAISLVTASS
jgi:hypothetical protein